MTATVFLVLLTICATATSLASEAIKKFLDGLKVSYASNILVLAVAVVIGCGGDGGILCKLPDTLYHAEQRVLGSDGRCQLDRGDGGV